MIVLFLISFFNHFFDDSLKSNDIVYKFYENEVYYVDKTVKPNSTEITLKILNSNSIKEHNLSLQSLNYEYTIGDIYISKDYIIILGFSKILIFDKHSFKLLDSIETQYNYYECHVDSSIIYGLRCKINSQTFQNQNFTGFFTYNIINNELNEFDIENPIGIISTFYLPRDLITYGNNKIYVIDANGEKINIYDSLGIKQKTIDLNMILCSVGFPEIKESNSLKENLIANRNLIKNNELVFGFESVNKEFVVLTSSILDSVTFEINILDTNFNLLNSKQIIDIDFLENIDYNKFPLSNKLKITQDKLIDLQPIPIPIDETKSIKNNTKNFENYIKKYGLSYSFIIYELNETGKNIILEDIDENKKILNINDDYLILFLNGINCRSCITNTHKALNSLEEELDLDIYYAINKSESIVEKYESINYFKSMIKYDNYYFNQTSTNDISATPYILLNINGVSKNVDFNQLKGSEEDIKKIIMDYVK